MIYSTFIKYKFPVHRRLTTYITNTRKKPNINFEEQLNIYYKFRINTTYKKRYEENMENNSLHLLLKTFFDTFNATFIRKHILIDKYNRLIIDETFIYILMKKDIFRKKIMLAAHLIKDLKKYKIISKKSQSIKKCKKSDPNAPHDHFILEDLQYYDKILDKRDSLLKQLENPSSNTEFSANLSIFIKLYLFQNIHKKVLINISRDFLYELGEKKIVWIGTIPVRKNEKEQGERVNIQFFEPRFNNLLQRMFFNIDNNTTLFEINYEYSIKKNDIKNHIKTQYPDILSDLMKSGYSEDKAFTFIRKIIANAIAMENELHSQAFVVTLMKQTHYPQITLSELLELYPNLRNNPKIIQLHNLEKQNIEKQKYLPENEDFEEDFEEDLVENYNELEYINTDLTKYNELEKIQSFYMVYKFNHLQDKQKKEYDKYLLNFSKFKYGNLLGSVICTLENNPDFKEKFQSRIILIKHINKIIEKDIGFQSIHNDEIKRFYTLCEKLVAYKDFDNIILKTILSLFPNNKSNKQLSQMIKDSTPYFELKTLIPILNHIESLILQSRLNKQYQGRYSAKYIYNTLNILFNYCFNHIIKKDFITLIVVNDIEQAIKQFIHKETYNTYKNPINRFLSQFGFKIGINASIKKYTNKGLITKSDLNKLYDYCDNLNIGHPSIRMKPFIYFLILYYTGARKETLLYIKRKDLYIIKDKIYINVKKGKTEAAKRRISSVSIEEKYIQLLQNYLNNLKNNNSMYLFPNDILKGRSAPKRNFIDTELQNILEKVVNYKYVTIHSFRHTFYTMKLLNILYENPDLTYKGKFYDLINEMGHSGPNIGLTYYAHLDYILYLYDLDLF